MLRPWRLTRTQQVRAVYEFLTEHGLTATWMTECRRPLAALPAATTPALDRAMLVALVAAGLFTLARRRLWSLAGLAVSRLLPAAWLALWPTVRIRERDGGGTTVEIRRRR